MVGERLRFYSDKTNLKFSKTNRNFLLANANVNLDDIFAAIDEVNKYFDEHREEVIISNERKESKGYIYHIDFGFGSVMSQENNICKVKFDDDSVGIKTIQLDHQTYENISRQDYEKKLKPNGIKEKSSAGRVEWDKFESALLIEAFWKIENNEGSRNDILTKLSNDLRARAVHTGQKIDDKFRNLNGMNFQLSNIALSFYPERSAVHRTAMFDTVANIYKSDRKEFNRILLEAHEQVNAMQNYTSVDNKKYAISMAEVDFYSYIKDTYFENHKTDGKSYRAPQHAKKCIDILRNVNEMLLLSSLEINNIYSASNVNEFYQILSFVKGNLKDKSEGETKWILYALNRYKMFIIGEKKIHDNQKSDIQSASLENMIFYIKTRESESAKMIVEKGRYKVLAGSNYIITPGISFTDAERETRRSMQLAGIIKDGKFLKDYSFSSASTAATQVLSRSVNGKVEWKSENGQCLGDILEDKNIIEQDKRHFIDRTINLSFNGDAIIQDYISVKERMNMHPDYVKVLQEYFPDGFAYENQLRKRRFISGYLELNGTKFEDTDELYEKKLFIIGFNSEGKIYLPSIVDSITCEALKKYIDKNLDTIGSIIYYSVIYNSFSDRLNVGFSEDMLKNYLIYTFDGLYHFDRECLSKVGTTGYFKKDLINLFMNTGHPMEIEEIYSKMPNITQQAIDEMLRDRDFVVNFRGKSYFYKDIFDIADEQLDEIRNFIRNIIQEKDYVSGTELYAFICEKMPELIELNPDITELGVKNSIKLLLDDEFSFKGDVISESDRQIDVKELYREFCRGREKFTLEELETFKDSIHKSYIDYNAVFEISIRVDANTYVRRDIINFNVEKIDNAILNYCKGKYVSYSDIINFIEFPTMQYPWNCYVLEGYLFSESKKFSILNAAFNKERPVGAIIKKYAFDSFDDLIVDVIKENKLFNKEKAFEYLQDNYFILTRKFKNIDLLINKAKM